MEIPTENLLLATCHEHFLAHRLAEAFPLACELVQRLGKEPSTALFLALDIMQECCEDAGQPFFAAELRRYLCSVGEPPSLAVELCDCEDQSPLAKDVRGFIRCLVSGWHRLGIPLVPSLGLLSFADAALTLQPRPHLRSMSWWCPVPMRMSDGTRPVALVTAFDFSVEGDAREVFQIEVDEASRAMDEAWPVIAANGTKAVGIVTRLPRKYIEDVLTGGARVLEQGVLPQTIPIRLEAASPEEWIYMADKMLRLDAHLFASSLYKESGQLFMRDGDIRACFLAREKEALAVAAVGQYEQARRILADVLCDANDFAFTDVASKIEHTMRRLFPSESELNRTPPDEPAGPFTFDPGTGKVIGGMYIEDALHEYKAAELLNKTWEELFPNESSPFVGIYFVNALPECEAPVLGRPGETKKLRLGSVGRQARGARLDRSDLPALVGNSNQEYLLHFAISIFRAIRLMHVHLSGSFTSPTGTSLSPGNLTPDPKIYDYETVRIPQLGDAVVAREYQHADVVHGFLLVFDVVERLSCRDALTACLTACFVAYQSGGDHDNGVQGKVDALIANHLSTLTDPTTQQQLSRDLANALFALDDQL
jgi:hypothetical protein